MKILPVSAFYDNYIWMGINENTQEAFCVDPGEAKPVITFLEKENLKLKAILLTHHHHDHIDGTSELIEKNPAIAVYGPNDPRMPQVTNVIKEKDSFSLLDIYQFQVLDTPGHTSTHISFYESHYGWLFCGDTLFSAGCGRVFDGTIKALHDSLQKLKSLPDKTQIYCAHEYTQQNLRFAAMVDPDNLTIRHHALRLLAKENLCSLPSNLALEKQINPFLRTDTEKLQAYTTFKGCKKHDSLSVFKQLRADKDVFYS